jgi:ABC-type Mn2+/Zn2+ transport system permease subunit
MIDWLVAPFGLAFQQRALIGGALAAIALAIVGTWVVIRGMSFLGDALVHGVVPGIALAIVLGFNEFLGAALAALIMLGGINLVHRQTTFGEDTGIGLLFVGMLGLGVIIISRSESFAGSLTSVLFGDLLGVTDAEIAVLAVVAVVAGAACIVLYRPLLALAFNEAKASTLGLRPRLVQPVLLALIIGVVIASFPAVGTMLVFGLLVGPAATAALVVKRVPAMIGVAAVIGVVAVGVGLTLSYYLDTSASATVAVTPIVAFFAVLALKTSRRAKSPIPSA